MAEADENLRLPDFFPLVDRKKKCKGVADTFFSCFSEKARQEENVRSTVIAQEGLEGCKKELKKYEACMEKQNIGKNMRLIRAPEAYLEILGAQKD